MDSTSEGPEAANTATSSSVDPRSATPKRTTFEDVNNPSRSEDTTLTPRRTRTHTRTSSEPPLEGESAFVRLKRTFTSNMVPERPVKAAPLWYKQLWFIISASWLNVLLVCIPVSWALHFATPNSSTIVFVFSFLAIIPLAKLLAFATDELSLRVGQTLAGLLNATLGNAVELIVSIIALVKCELSVVQSSLIGSILSNLLLVLGMCFFAGGLRFSEQGFGSTAMQLNSSLLTISVIAVLLPAAFYFALDSNTDPTTLESPILKLSHGVAIILLFIYGSYLIFQLVTHTNLYEDGRAEDFKSTAYPDRVSSDKHSGLRGRFDQGVDKIRGRKPNSSASLNGEADSSAVERQETGSEGEGEGEQPQLSVLMTLFLLAAVTVLVAVTAEFLVDSINGITASGAISKEWVGLILLPIVGNAAEHVTAVTVSVKDKLTLSIGVAVGSSIQIALFVIPFIVTLGWILGKPLAMLFDPFQSIVLFLSVLTVNYVVADSKSNWLEGMILMCLYLIIAVSFWFYPGSTSLPSEFLQC